MEDAMNAHETIRQIGAMNLAAIGARNFVAGESTLHFNVLRGSSTKVVVTLDPTDTYTVELVDIGNRRNGYAMKTLETVAFVYCDQIGDVVRSMCNR
ncbi:MAG: hypothetical protein WC642_08430 [Nocardioides sp.]|jgi:hypothetical protein